MTTRRKLLVAAAGSSLVALYPAALAQTGKAPVLIGWLSADLPDSDAPRLQLFKEALATLGRREGTDFVINAYWAPQSPVQLRTLAEQLAAKNPAVIVTAPRNVTMVAAEAAPRIPVVQVFGGSPVERGLAASLARPGGMVTGLTNLGLQFSEKHTELLADVIPNLQRVGYLLDNSIDRPRALDEQMETASRAAKRYKAEAIFANASKKEDLEPAFAQFSDRGVQGIVVPPSNWIFTEARRTSQLALNHRLPLIATPTFAEAGALIGHGPDLAYNYRRAAWYVDQILQGRKPGDLPIEQPIKFMMVVNTKTAKALGITIPRWILLQADRLIG